MRWGAAVVVLLVAACTSPAPPTASPALTQAPTASPSPAVSQSPGPTDGASPAQSSLPSAPPTPGPQGLHVDQALISDHLDALQAIADANGGIRAAGTPGYEASADYVEQVMTDLGFLVERHSFDFPFFDETAPVEIGFGDLGWSSP
jgi:hypothetical protein